MDEEVKTNKKQKKKYQSIWHRLLNLTELETKKPEDMTKEELLQYEESKRLSRVQFHILAIVCIIIFCIAIAPKTLQNDTFYTLKIGELITDNGVDMMDHFSWHENLPYTYPHWLYDLGMFQLFNLGEMTGLTNGGMLFIYISTCVLSATLGLLMYATGNKICKHPLVAFILTLGAMFMLKPFIAARAQLVTFNLFTLEILLIESFLVDKKKRHLLRTDSDIHTDSKCSLRSMANVLRIFPTIYWRIFNNMVLWN